MVLIPMERRVLVADGVSRFDWAVSIHLLLSCWSGNERMKSELMVMEYLEMFMGKWTEFVSDALCRW